MRGKGGSTRNLLIAALLIWTVIFFGIGVLYGIGEGFDTGYRVAFHDIDSRIAEAARDGHVFFIRGLTPKFVPRADGAVNVQKAPRLDPSSIPPLARGDNGGYGKAGVVDIAGIGSEGYSQVWEGGKTWQE